MARSSSKSAFLKKADLLLGRIWRGGRAVVEIPVSQLRNFTERLLVGSGLPMDHAVAMADVMVKTELLGHRTHGLAMLPTYIERVKAGAISSQGAVSCLSETASSLHWQAHRLPGAVVVNQAIDALFEKLAHAPVATASIANCSHIGSLQSYLLEPMRRNYLALMMVTDPGIASVAPFGGCDPVLTSNPIAIGIPTHGDPILIDQCTSVVSNAQVAAHHRAGREVPEGWLLDGDGKPTQDGAALNAEPPGTILPLGGLEFGYKGFGLGLMVEAFALALSGHGRGKPKQRGSQGVFLQLIDPAHFSSVASFLDETSHVAKACLQSRPGKNGQNVRLPGQRALADLAKQSEKGLEVSDETWAEIAPWAQQFNVPLPR